MSACFVHKDYQKANIGSYLVESGLRKIGDKEIHIQIATVAGQNLYKRHGFEVVVLREGDVGNGKIESFAEMKRGPLGVTPEVVETWRDGEHIDRTC